MPGNLEGPEGGWGTGTAGADGEGLHRGGNRALSSVRSRAGAAPSEEAASRQRRLWGGCGGGCGGCRQRAGWGPGPSQEMASGEAVDAGGQQGTWTKNQSRQGQFLERDWPTAPSPEPRRTEQRARPPGGSGGPENPGPRLRGGSRRGGSSAQAMTRVGHGATGAARAPRKGVGTHGPWRDRAVLS